MDFICKNCNLPFIAKWNKTGCCKRCYAILKSRAWRTPEENQKRASVKKAEWYQANKTYVDEKNAQWRAEHPERTKEVQNIANRRFYAANRERMVVYHGMKNRERQLRDPMVNLAKVVRNNLRQHFKTKHITKQKRTLEYIGCSWDQLFEQFESQFEPGMTWNNYGKAWTIDHVCPCAQAKTPEELFKLQHHSNLKPMSPVLNLQKSAKRTLEGELLCQTLLDRNWM